MVLTSSWTMHPLYISVCFIHNRKLFVNKFWIFFLLYYLSSRITLHAQRKINSDSITNQAASYTCTSVIKAYINLKSIYLDTCTFHVNRVTNKLLSTILSLFISKQIYFHFFLQINFWTLRTEPTPHENSFPILNTNLIFISILIKKIVYAHVPESDL